MARLQDCRCGMGYGHRLCGSNAYYVILLTGKDSHLTISIACFNMRKETVGPSQAVIRLSCFAGLGMGVILTLLCGVFSEELISCVIDSEGIREYGTPLVRTLLLSGPVMGILFIYINTLQAIGAEAAQPVAEFFPSFWLFGCFGGLKREWGKLPLLFNLRSLSDITCHYLIAVWKGISFRGSGINLNGCSALYPQWSDINGHTVLLRSPVNPTWNDSSNTMKIISRQNTGINLSATSEKIKTYKKSPGSAKLHAIKKILKNNSPIFSMNRIPSHSFHLLYWRT